MHLPRLVLLLLAVLLIGACGASDTPSTRFVAQSTAADFQTTLDAVEEDLEADRCDEAGTGIDRLRAQVDGWPSAYDAELVSNVLQWVDRIDVRLEADCGEEEPTATPTEEPTVTPEPTPEETPTEEPTPEETPTPSATPEETPEIPDATPTPPSDAAPDTGGAEGGEG